jgi:peptidoglycan/LPS O-acetylase OafA/YrhL
MTRSILLSEAALGRANNFDLLRLIAASLVLISHAFTLSHANPAHPFIGDPISQHFLGLAPFSGGIDAQAVHIFFFISGFLVARSFLRRSSVRGFIKARLLRIVPALWVNLVFCTLMVGLFATRLSWVEYLLQRKTWSYFFVNASLINTLYRLPGVFEELPIAEAVNGSLWTLPHEFRMYGWVMLLGVTGMLAHRRGFLLLFAALLGLELISGKGIVLGHADIFRLWVFFFLGIGACLWADRLRLSPLILLAMLVPLPLLWHAPRLMYDLWAAAAFSYALLLLAYWRYWPRLNPGRFGDISYGVYLYAFPVQQMLIMHFGPGMDWGKMVALSFALTVPLATASWFFVEKPALARKRAATATPGTLIQPVQA